jgi:predicted RNA binding protein YcfA (HicA-like mRNA interferase family)
MKKQKLLQKVLSGTKNVRFTEAVALAEAFGFRLDRINGSHHIFIHPEIPELWLFVKFNGNARKQLRQRVIAMSSLPQ